MSTHTKTPKIHTTYRPIRSVSVTGIRQMYEVFAACHDQPSLDIFIRDLSKKTGVIKMVNAADGRIVGFSTQTITRMTVDGRPIIAVLSDDAVVLPAHWPHCDLAAAAQRLLLRLKLRHPFTPVYWCQLARHYRSYLLMAAHAPRLYPSTHGTDAPQRRVAQMLGKQLFPESFDSRKMLLSLTGDHIVRPNLADCDITPQLAQADARIALFRKMNPGWRKGSALLSVTAFDAQSTLASLQSGARRWFRRHILRNYSHPQQAGSQPAQANNSQQHASWQDSSLDEALERGETS